MKNIDINYIVKNKIISKTKIFQYVRKQYNYIKYYWKKNTTNRLFKKFFYVHNGSTKLPRRRS